GFAIVIALERDGVRVAPTRARAAARELAVQRREVGHLVVAELAEIRRIRDARKRIATAAALLVVAVGVNQRDAFAEKVISVLQVTVRREPIVVTLREHDAIRCPESTRISLLVARER